MKWIQNDDYFVCWAKSKYDRNKIQSSSPLRLTNGCCIERSRNVTEIKVSLRLRSDWQMGVTLNEVETWRKQRFSLRLRSDWQMGVTLSEVETWRKQRFSLRLRSDWQMGVTLSEVETWKKQRLVFVSAQTDRSKLSYPVFDIQLGIP